MKAKAKDIILKQTKNGRQKGNNGISDKMDIEIMLLPSHFKRSVKQKNI